MGCRTAIGVLASTVTIAILQTKVEVVIGLNGSLFGSLIMFAIPGLMYLMWGNRWKVRRSAGRGDKGTLRSLLLVPAQHDGESPWPDRVLTAAKML